MRARRVLWHLCTVFILVSTAGGCRVGKSYKFASDGFDRGAPSPSRQKQALSSTVDAVATSNECQVGAVVQPASLTVPAAEEIAAPTATETATQPAALDVDWLVAEVLTRNPDVRSAAAAWQAAAERYPQEVSLDDPMLGSVLGPGSWGNSTVTSAYAIEMSQKLPWPGKRRLRGNIAQAEANAAYYDVGEERLRVAELTRLAYYEYFVTERQREVLKDSSGLLESFRKIAQSKYESASVEQQDVLLADVELGQLERQRLALDRQARVARARINTLLLLPADAPLASPPASLSLPDDSRSPQELQSLAVAQRPELAAQEAKIRAERYTVSLAYKEFYPDIEVLGRYDAFWQEDPLRPMVGMNLNMPLNKQKRWAAVREARARVVKEQAVLDSKIAELSFDVEQAYSRVDESRKTLDVYKGRLVPAARQSVESARASYTAGSLDFLRLIESQRQSLSIQEAYYQATAEYFQRLAELDRIIGAIPPQMNSPEDTLSVE